MKAKRASFVDSVRLARTCFVCMWLSQSSTAMNRHEKKC